MTGEQPPEPREGDPLGEFFDRFNALAIEAKGHGIRTVAVLVLEDHFEDTTQNAIVSNTGAMLGLGAASYLIDYFRRSLRRSEGR